MKKFIYISLALISYAALSISCSKEIEAPEDVEVVNPQDDNTTTPAEDQTSGRQITISATLSDALTKVTFTPGLNDQNKPMLSLTWESGDKLRVANHANNSSYSDFELYSGSIGQKEGIFTGTLVSATSYDVWVLHEDDITNMQVQDSDGDASHIKYIAQATDVTFDNEGKADITFTDVSSVLGIQAKLPAGAAANIDSVVLTASENIFFEGKTLTLGITTPGDANGDDILNLYATLPSGSQAIPAGTTLFVKFNASGATHKVYTAYRELGSGLTFASGALNNLKMNCVNTDKYAGKDDDGTAAHPYLIADKYQLNSVHSLMANNATKYFKMIDDVDMDGMTWNVLNPEMGGTGSPDNPGYVRSINFDGNNKTISHLGKHFFYVFKGSIQNLTLSGSSVGTSRGIFAEYCQGTGHIITNVDITGGSMATTSANGGAMIGRINNGSGTTLTITDCDVTNTTVSGAAQTGGLIGSADAQVVVEDCTVTDSPVTASGVNSGGLIGNTTGVVTITDCTVSGTDVSGTGVVGGMVGFANSQVTISGSKYTGGTVEASSKFCGGFLGSTLDVASTITNCQVEDATVTTSYNDDSRCGGFVGQLQTSCRVEGCTVGTSAKKVTVSTPQVKRSGSSGSYTYSKLNSGGFVGVNYGTITKNGEVRSKAYVKITTANTYGTPLDLGGFVGFGRGTIEYCDAVVDMTSLKGQYIGGFAGYVINAGTVIDHCTVDGTVTGNNYTGGFAGYVDSGDPVISNCTASGSVTAQSGCGGFVGQTMTGVFTNCSTSATCSFNGSNNGGFAGQIHGGTLTGCSESGSVTSTSTGTTFGGFVGLIHDSCTLDKCSAAGNVTSNSKSYFGGFIGAINNGSNILIKRCYASGNVTCDQTYVSAFLGNINQGTDMTLGSVTIENCYATGNIINSNQMRGGLIAAILSGGPVTVSNCYTTGEVVGSFRLGGLIGNIAIANVTVEHCAAWNSKVTASNIGSGSWSTGAVVGTAFPSCTLTDNYRKADMSVKAFWGNVSGTPGTDGYTWELTSDYNHPNVDGSDSSTYLVVRDKTTGSFGVSTTATLTGGNYPIFPYHGKVEAGKTLSQLASTTLGWSSDIWDFSGELPTLK